MELGQERTFLGGYVNLTLRTIIVYNIDRVKMKISRVYNCKLEQGLWEMHLIFIFIDLVCANHTSLDTIQILSLVK